LGEWAAASLDIARGDVVEHQRAALEVTLGQRGFDLGLTFEQPVERGVEFIFVDLSQIEHRAEAGGRGSRVEGFGGRKLGDGRNQPRHDHGDDQIAAAVTNRSQQPIETNLSQCAEYGRDMAVGQRALDRDGLLAGRQHGATLEQGAQTFDQGRRPVAEIEQRAFLDLVAVAIALAQQDGGGRIAVGDGFDIHGQFVSILSTNVKI
jgi:hypothetical protein